MKRAHALKRLVTGTSMIGLLTFSNMAGAIFPVTDYAALVQRILGNIQEAQQWIEEKTRLKYNMDMNSVLTGMQNDNSNNGFANVIARIGGQQEQLHDLEIQEREAPDKDACEVISTNEAYQQGAKVAAAAKAAARKAYSAKHGNFRSTPSQQVMQRAVAVKQLLADCPVAADGTSPCLATEGLLGAGDATSYSNDAAARAAVDKQIELIAGPVPNFKSDPARIGTDSANMAKAAELRRELMRKLVHTSLTEISGMRAGTPSQLESLKSFALDRFGGSGADNWIKLATATSEDKYTNPAFAVSPSELTRKMAIMDAFMVNLGVLQYEQSLRQEALLAGILSDVVEPLK